MASTINCLRITALRSTYRIRPRRSAVLTTINASFHTTTYQPKESAPSFASTLGPSDRAFYDALSPEERKEYEEADLAVERHMRSPEVERRLNSEVTAAIRRLPNDEPADEEERFKPGLISMGEGDDMGEDEVFQGDDMSSIAHDELQQHRELREYARIAAWEMPLLSSMEPHIFCSPYPVFDIHTPCPNQDAPCPARPID
jgi:hypothetical protein